MTTILPLNLEQTSAILQLPVIGSSSESPHDFLLHVKEHALYTRRVAMPI